jgi:hypothetical protein
MNQSLRPLLLLTAPLLLGLVSCKKDPAEPLFAPVIPLAVGNSWEYMRYRYSPTGALRDSSLTETRVLRDTMLNKQTWYVLNDGRIVANDVNGYLYYNHAGQQPVVTYQHFKRASNISYAYDYPNYRLWVQTSNTAPFAPVPESRARYTAYRYQIEYRYEYPNAPAPEVQLQDAYLDPKIGLVREDLYYREMPTVLQQRFELIRYTLK